MANDLNRCEFIGRLSRDPESRFTAEGTQVVSFSIACGRKYKDREETEWVNIVAFGKLAEICAAYLTKGKQIYVAGRLNTQKYQDKTTGQDRYATRIIADQMQMLGDSGAQNAKTDPQTPLRQSYERQRPPQSSSFDDMGDVPF